MARNRILITGISSGIGWALAKEYLNSGDEVFGCSRRKPEGLNEENLFFQEMDLADLEQTKANMAKWTEGVDKFGLVILNAAFLGEIRDIQDCSLSYLKNMMDVNLWSNKVICDSLFANQTEVKQVVAISSGASINGNRGWNGYSISKAALNMMIKLYAVEQTNTHFISLAPGIVDTAMQDYLCAHSETDKYSSLVRLQKARGTKDMPSAEELAPRLQEAFERLISYPSGDYVDIRKMS